MNFVINIYLSRHLSGSDKILGSFIGEFVKMPARSDSEISRGILFSRRIFNFIKTHPSFFKTRNRMNHRYLRLQEEFILLSYCHFLSAHWEKYSQDSWESAFDNTRMVLHENREYIPYKLNTVLPVLLSNKELLQIDTLSRLDKYLQQLASKRFIGGKIQDTLQDLLENYSAIKQDFEELMPDLDLEIKYLIDLEQAESKPVLANAC